jgi:predicted O-linked N-acetylglucosamine transferase (SPINDLY family)
LGAALAEEDRFEEAIAAYQMAVRVKPDYAEAYNNLGNALREVGLIDQAIVAFREALRLLPHCAEANHNIGLALAEMGQLLPALVAHRLARDLKPDSPAYQSTIIFTFLYLAEARADEMGNEIALWNRRFSEPAKASIRPHINNRDPDRRLRIGYLSSDLRGHVVGWNVRPLFRFHDTTRFEIFCYSDTNWDDNFTAEFRGLAHAWRVTAGISEAEVAKMILADAVDVLVDLSQHTAGNHLPIFARQPAPVQVSFAGYPESAGVEAIRRRISDRWLEGAWAEMATIEGRPNGIEGVGMENCGWKIDKAPTGSAVAITPERTFLIDSFWCYDPSGMEVIVNDLPAKTNGWITFGSLNNFCKINDKVLKLWARMLAEVKGSRLLLLSGYGSHRQRTIDLLAQHGVESGCVEFAAPCRRKDYLELYHRVDIALDPFPYGGHTTSLDALWMGVPVASLAGERAVSRAGLSILNNLGLPELVAFSEDEYVSIAVNLANDLPRLTELRRTLRSRMERSVLMDGPSFARQIEAAYRAMWREWCAKQEASSP